MSEFNPDKTGLEKYSGKGLVNLYYSKNNELERGRINLEMNRRLIDEISEFNKTSSRQSNKMINLTWWIIALTIFLAILTFIQVIKLFS